MTDQTPEKAPAPGKTPPDPQAKVDDLRTQLAVAEAALPPEPGTVRLRVLPPQDSFTVGAVTVGASPTDVPAHAVARLMGAAGEAGVKLEEV